VPRQTAVTIIAEIRPGETGSLAEMVDAMGNGLANETRIPFSAFPQLHFARLFIVPAATDDHGNQAPASLVLLADIDGPSDRFLGDLVDRASNGLTELFAHCVGFPEDDGSPASTLLDYLRAHQIRPAAMYVNTVGRSVQQVRDEAALQSRIAHELDANADDLSALAPEAIRDAIRDRVTSDPEFAWAKSPARGLSLLERARELAHLIGVGLLLILLLPIAVIGFPVGAIVIRLRELRERPQRFKPTATEVDCLAELEDLAVHNPFTAVGFLKPGRLRLWTARILLWLTNLAMRHHFNKGQLTGVRTIHFARWILTDGNRRLIFASNYDGSLESYMDEFIDKVAWGLNAIFSNGQGYPKSKWLIFGGAKDERAFKGYLRAHQIPTRAWYSAYPALTAANIGNNAAIRAGFSGKLDETASAIWLRRL
jgi:hypothetical protein